LFGAIVAYALTLNYFVTIQEKTLLDLYETNRSMNDMNQRLIQQKEEIFSQRDVLERQKDLIEARNFEIISAIRFAKNIQQSILPSEKMLNQFFSDYFILNKPKAVISGDFFWMKEHHGKVFVAVVDCTGHGVPGALVSMVVHTFLGRAFNEIRQPNPSTVLNYVNKYLIQEFKTNEGIKLQIGMDIAMVSFDFSNHTMEYSGAFNPILVNKQSLFTQLEASKFIMGISLEDNQTRFENQVLNFEKGDRIYLFTDGIVDQFGGEFHKKYGYQQFRGTMQSIGSYEMSKQLEMIELSWKKWKGQTAQTDDILLLGLEV
jgi:serine phosphatase RsbU (regulator of sigma subunit)